MAKDGTNRGGARLGSGQKKKPIVDKILDGNPGHRKLTVMEFSDTTDLIGETMPEPNEYLTAKQKDGTTTMAAVVFENTWRWLNERGCAQFVTVQLIEQYAQSVARWIQCEQAINDYGFLAKHPTTQAAIASPYVSMSQNFMKQVNNIWFQIYQVVRENCTTDYSGRTPQDDVMDKLLSQRRR